MPATPLDSPMYRGLLGDGQAAQLFTDGAEVRAMLLVLGELARAQGAEGLIPEVSAAAIHRASREVQVDGAALAEATGANGVPVPALVPAFRAAMNAPEHGAWVHFGATSQDIVDTGLMLRLRQLRAILLERTGEACRALGALAEAHAETPLAARTWGQAAVPTTFGAVAASWGWPLLAARDDLDRLTFPVSLSGAAGTLQPMGTAGPAVRARMADALGLTDPGRGWHTDRTPVIRTAQAMTALTRALGKMGEDLILLTQTGVAEVRIAGAGASSTMPQKANPVMPSLLSALARTSEGLSATVAGAGVQRQGRDGAAWMTEWMVLPQLCLVTARAAAAGRDLAGGIEPDAGSMAEGLRAGDGAIFAEALTFALARTLPRPEAAARVKALVAEAAETGETLEARARAAFPDLPDDMFDGAAQSGTARADARAFAEAVRGAG